MILENDIVDFNGTLRVADSVSGSVKSPDGTTKISFSQRGAIQTSTCHFDVLGSYDPNTTFGRDRIFLSNNGIINTVSGENIAQDVIIEPGASAKIIGTPSVSGIISLSDQTSILELELKNRLSTDIILNGGCLKLLDTLKLADNKCLIGDGSIILNNQTLSFSGLWAGDLTFQDSGDLQFCGPVTLSGTWDFSQAGGKTIINGNGNILDLDGGTLNVAQDHELIITDLKLHGLGSGGQLTLFDSATNPGKITLRNVVLELDASYTLAAGLISVSGGSLKITNKAFDVFVIDGPNTKFLIDGNTVFYDTLLGNPHNPLTTTNGGTVVLKNNGVIRPNLADSQMADTIINADLDGSRVFVGNKDLSLISRVCIQNRSMSSQAIKLDGQNSVWNFPYEPSLKVLVIADNTDVTLENLLLKNFSLDNVSFGTNSSLNFGDGTRLDLLADMDISSGTGQLCFTGNAALQGLGQTITINSADGIIQKGVAKRLGINNLNIKINNPNGLSCSEQTGEISLKNCSITLGDDGFDFLSGSIFVENLCTIRSGQRNPENLCQFKFSSSGNLRINSGSTLKITRAVDFVYQPNPLLDGGNTMATKRHLIMQDKSSTLFLDECSLSSTATAMALDYGNLIIDNKVKLNTSFGQGEAVELSADLNTEILADAQFVINGVVKIATNP